MKPLPPEPIGLANLLAFDRLPYLKDGVSAHYEGSIDKRGGNADWDWWLYQDRNGEWVLFDDEGPGCIYNFTQHRYPASEEPTFRFYFDGEDTPRWTIRLSEFGHRFPFVEPLAARYQGPDAKGRGPIWVVRSFVPMPYAKRCKITSDIQLHGQNKDYGLGGWGHVMYHRYTTADGITSFTGAEDYQGLIDLWQRCGEDPKPNDGNASCSVQASVPAGGTTDILTHEGASSIAAIRLQLNAFTRERLHDIWLRIHWDGQDEPAVLCPFGAFFANEWGEHAVRYLAQGMDPESGSFYCYLPMPFWQNARVSVENRSPVAITLGGSIELRDAGYERERCGYFHATYTAPTHGVRDRDFRVGSFRGRGHLVASLITSAHKQAGMGTCEGDVRIHIDGSRTPQIESDGSESYASYGWGFPTPPEVNPASGYDGHPNSPWSMYRSLLGDWNPFRAELKFGIELGSHNDQMLSHSGALFAYLQPTPGIALSDELVFGDRANEEAHHYEEPLRYISMPMVGSYEGDEELRPYRGYLRSCGECRFTVRIDPRNCGVRLLRRGDQGLGRQRVVVFVDDQQVEERGWYQPDRNPWFRLLDDAFEIPAAMTAGKSELRIRLVVTPCGEATTWEAYRYRVFSHLPVGIAPRGPVLHDDLPDWHATNARAIDRARVWGTGWERGDGEFFFNQSADGETVFVALTHQQIEDHPDLSFRIANLVASPASRIELLGPHPDTNGGPGKPIQVTWQQTATHLRLQLVGETCLLVDHDRFPRPLIIAITAVHARGVGEEAREAEGSQDITGL